MHIQVPGDTPTQLKKKIKKPGIPLPEKLKFTRNQLGDTMSFEPFCNDVGPTCDFSSFFLMIIWSFVCGISPNLDLLL